MSALYTWDVFSTLDGYGSFAPGADWGGYWGKQGPELLEHRSRQLAVDQRMVFGARTFLENVQIRRLGPDHEAVDPWTTAMLNLPATVVSSSLRKTHGWPGATIVSGDPVAIVTALKHESPVPLRSQASMTLNRALLAAGLVDRLQVTIFPVITGRTGTSPVLAGLGDVDLELLESRTFDGRSHELLYRPTPRPTA